MRRRRFSKRERVGGAVYWTRTRDADGKRIYVQAESEEALIMLLAQRQAEAKAAAPMTGNRDATLDQYAEPWLQRVKADLKYATARTYQTIYATHLAPALGSFKLREIGRVHIKMLVNAKRDAGYSKATLRLVRAVLVGILGAAVDDGVIQVNVGLAAGGRHKRADSSSEMESQASIRPFSEAQLADLLSAARDHQDRTLLTLLARTGARPGEASALKWSDIDFDAREILIERALYRGRLGSPKTGKRRRVDMSRELATALSALRIQREREQLRGLHTDWIFCGRHGQPLTDHALRAIFDRTMKHAGLSGHTTYDLRHTFASALLQNGAPITYVAAQLGHSGPATTLKYYSHWIPSGDKRFVDALDSGTNLQKTRALYRESVTTGLTTVKPWVRTLTIYAPDRKLVSFDLAETKSAHRIKRRADQPSEN